MTGDKVDRAISQNNLAIGHAEPNPDMGALQPNTKTEQRLRGIAAESRDTVIVQRKGRSPTIYHTIFQCSTGNLRTTTNNRAAAAAVLSTCRAQEALFSRHLDSVVVFTVNHSFYPTTSAATPVSFLTLHPREIKSLR